MRDLPGESSLFEAIKSNNSEIVELLLNAGADPNGRYHRSMTPLSMAVVGYEYFSNPEIEEYDEAGEESALKIIDLLLQYGADPRLKIAYGASAYDEARNHSLFNIVQRMGPMLNNR
jgi:ankyrin repeat protein